MSSRPSSRTVRAALVDVEPDMHTGMDPAEKLRVRDPAATASFLHSWIGAVHRYCATVCDPDLVPQAVEVAFADFFEKVESHGIDQAHVEPALLRSTRLTAAEGARLDEGEATAEDNGDGSFKCETTSLVLAGSPTAPAGVDGLRRMRHHVAACSRCQASEARFMAAEDGFLASGDVEAPHEVLQAVQDRFSISLDQADAEPAVERPSSRPEDQVTETKQRVRGRGLRHAATDEADTILEAAERDAEDIRQGALRDAGDIRRQAITAAERLMGRLHALELPLGQLVADIRDETERVAAEIERGPHLDSHATPLPSGEDNSTQPAPRTVQKDQGDDEDRTGPADQPPPVDAERVAEEAVVEERARRERELAAAADFYVPGPAVGEPAEKGKLGRILGRRGSKRAAGAFITAEGSCAVCQRTFKAGDEDELSRSQWKVSGDVGLCPDCQSERWQLPEGGRAPFRRGGS